MARKDLYHNNVRLALEKDKWLITDDPLDLSSGDVELLADLGAERILGAERADEKICVEIKCFVGQSPVTEFHKALGQYQNYELSLSDIEPDRLLFLAIPIDAWNDFFQRPFIQKAVHKHNIHLIIFDPLILLRIRFCANDKSFIELNAQNLLQRSITIQSFNG